MVRYLVGTTAVIGYLVSSLIGAPSISDKSVIHLDKNNYRQTIDRTDKKPIIIDIFATWCPPCKAMKPLFDRFAQEEAKKYIFADLDFQECQEIVAELGILSLPTVVVIQDKKVVGKFSGACKDLETLKKKIDEIFSFAGKSLKDQPKEMVQKKFSDALKSFSFEDIKACIEAGADVNALLESDGGPIALTPVLSVILFAQAAPSADAAAKTLRLLIDSGAKINGIQLPGATADMSLTDIVSQSISRTKQMLEIYEQFLKVLQCPPAECTGDSCAINVSKSTSSSKIEKTASIK